MVELGDGETPCDGDPVPLAVAACDAVCDTVASWDVLCDIVEDTVAACVAVTEAVGAWVLLGDWDTGEGDNEGVLLSE